MESKYKVIDVSNDLSPLALESWLNESHERGYELVHILQYQGVQLILRQKSNDPTKG